MAWPTDIYTTLTRNGQNLANLTEFAGHGGGGVCVCVCVRSRVSLSLFLALMPAYRCVWPLTFLLGSAAWARTPGDRSVTYLDTCGAGWNRPAV